MANDKNIYLGRRGKVSGPLSAEEFQKLKASGELENYTYVWEAGATAWKSLEAPPPPPSGARVLDTPLPSWATTEAVCHNFSSVISGHIKNITDSGCDLVNLEHSDTPRMGLMSNLVLNVIDPKRDKAMNVKATLQDVTREDGAWIYHLRWERRPSF